MLSRRAQHARANRVQNDGKAQTKTNAAVRGFTPHRLPHGGHILIFGQVILPHELHGFTPQQSGTFQLTAVQEALTETGKVVRTTNQTSTTGIQRGLLSKASATSASDSPDHTSTSRPSTSVATL